MTVINISRTDCKARLATQDYNCRAYNINRCLSRFFPNPNAFRRLQRETGLVISGSFALQFMERTCYPESDLDMYVMREQAAQVLDWIMGHAGVHYVFTPSDRWDEETFERWDKFVHSRARREEARSAGHAEEIDLWVHDNEYAGLNVFSFVRRVSAEEGERKIQVIICRESPMDEILSFHSSESSD